MFRIILNSKTSTNYFFFLHFFLLYYYLRTSHCDHIIILWVTIIFNSVFDVHLSAGRFLKFIFIKYFLIVLQIFKYLLQSLLPPLSTIQHSNRHIRLLMSIVLTSLKLDLLIVSMSAIIVQHRKNLFLLLGMQIVTTWMKIDSFRDTEATVVRIFGQLLHSFSNQTCCLLDIWVELFDDIRVQALQLSCHVIANVFLRCSDRFFSIVITGLSDTNALISSCLTFHLGRIGLFSILTL